MKTITLSCEQCEYVYNFMVGVNPKTTAWYNDFDQAFGAWYDSESIGSGLDTHTAQMSDNSVAAMLQDMIAEADTVGKSVTRIAIWGSLEKDYIDIGSLCVVSSIIKALNNASLRA